MMRLPDFVIIGAMKCATSTLHEQLARQKGVFMSTPKEPNFFSDDDVHGRGLEWYASLFREAAATDIRGESSTHYTKLPTYPLAAARMAEAMPAARVIYVMRHPVDRLVSHYVHAWTKREVRCSIDDAVRRHPELVDYGRYAMQLAPYLERFGKDAVLPVFVSHLKRDPNGALARIARFIGLNAPIAWDETLERQNESSRRMRDSGLRDALLRLPGMTTLRRAVVPQGVRDRVKQLWTMRQRPVLSHGRLREVEASFDEDLGRLGEWLGVRLSCEQFEKATASRALDWVEAPASSAA